METDRRRRITRIVILTAFSVLVLWLVVTLDEVFGPLLFALLLAYILNPVVNVIQKRLKLPRGGAIAVLFVVFYALFLAFFMMTVPAFVGQVGDLYQATIGEETYDEKDVPRDESKRVKEGYIRISEDDDPSPRYAQDRNKNGVFDPGYLRLIVDWFAELRARFGSEGDLQGYAVGAERLQVYLATTGEKVVAGVARLVGDAVFTIFGVLTLFVLIPIYLFYFLLGFASIRDRTTELLPGRYRGRIVSIGGRIDEAVSAFFKGRLIIMVIKGAMIAVALLIVGLPYALLLGVITGVGSLIPLLGSVCGLIPGVIIALLDTQSVGVAVVVAVIFIVIEVFENYALTPWILQDRVGLHPVTILVSVYVAGALFGFIGMLLSVPIASVAKILYTEFVLPEIKAVAAQEAPPPE